MYRSNAHSDRKRPRHRRHRHPHAQPASQPGTGRAKTELTRPASARESAAVAAGQILGGPAYDALIAFTAAEHNATLLSLDQRAAATYETVGANVEQLLR